jgi:hypothetical protein
MVMIRYRLKRDEVDRNLELLGAPPRKRGRVAGH